MHLNLKRLRYLNSQANITVQILDFRRKNEALIILNFVQNTKNLEKFRKIAKSFNKI